jgi:hypothetical protein
MLTQKERDTSMKNKACIPRRSRLFSFLGLHLEGAPDKTGAADPFCNIEEVKVGYPPRFDYQPHWLRFDPEVTGYWTFK